MLIAGVDEVGRGPLVGDVVAAAVILPPEHNIVGIKDSKKLTPARRLRLNLEIKSIALAWCIGSATPKEIDQINILQAAMLAMQRAVIGLSIRPDKVMVDGNRCPVLPYPCEAIVGGDNLIESIAAASILAKVHRDQQMFDLDLKYPNYGFAKHKGYCTELHLEALKKYGPVEEHRRSFSPVIQAIQSEDIPG